MKAKKVCYIIAINSSIIKLLERLLYLGAHWNCRDLGFGSDYMEIEITAREDLIPVIENEVEFYV